jgi:hypothetical protein
MTNFSKADALFLIEASLFIIGLPVLIVFLLTTF